MFKNGRWMFGCGQELTASNNTTDDGFGNRVSINLRISNNDALSNLDGLEKITSVRSLEIMDNEMLTSISGLYGLNTITGSSFAGDIDIANNPNLVTLHGLHNIQSIGGDLTINNNGALNTCHYPSICNFLTAGTGNINIQNNAPASDCFDQAAVDAACDAPIALALALLKLEASMHEKHVKLLWETPSEQNIDGFEIQRSSDGKDWSAIGWQDSKHFTNGKSTYTFSDYQPLSPFNYYRLKQIDNNGKFEFSNVVQVEWKETREAALLLFPNPTEDKLQIAIPENIATTDVMKVQVFNALGQMVLETILIEPVLEVKGLTNGIYWLQMEVGSLNFKASFVKN